MVAINSGIDGPWEAEAIRRRVMADVEAAAGGDISLFYSMVRRSDGGLAPAGVLASESEAAIRGLLGPGAPPAINHQLPDVTRCPGREADSFLTATHLFGTWAAFESRPFTQVVREQLDMGDQVRLLVYHGRRFVGWIGTFRRWGAPLFNAAERRRLNQLVPSVRAQLVAADTLEQAHLPHGPAYLVAGPDGRVLHATPEARPWLDRPDFTDHLSVAVRGLDRGGTPGSHVLDMAEVLVSRLDGEGGVRYLVCVRPAQRITRAVLASLSPVQRRIAEYIGAGAQRDEVATALGIGAETVRSHLRVVYERLGVANRLELARVLSEEES